MSDAPRSFENVRTDIASAAILTLGCKLNIADSESTAYVRARGGRYGRIHRSPAMHDGHTLRAEILEDTA